jgi:membrane protein implicated in regulation of membrane protease activity
MPDWAIWIIAAVVLGAGEMHIGTFFLAPFAVGALVAAIVAVIGAGLAPAFAAFLVVSLLSLWVLRPIARSHLRQPPELRTGTAALVGKHATVLERIANNEGVGCVKIDGEVWTARAYDDDEVIEEGARVHVIEIRGATALVSE